MRAWKVFVLGCIFTIIIGGLVVGEVYAQPLDMSQWVGKWFSTKTRLRGTTFSNSDLKFFKDSGGGPAFLKIWNWDAINQEFQFDICSFDRDVGKFVVDTDNKLHFLAGTDVKFLCWFEISDEGRPLTAFAAVMEGKQTTIGILKSANIKTLGGFYTDSHDQDTQFSAGAFTLTGKMVAPSKVPTDCTALIHH